jgi:GT2 family glycosyltransferase
MPAMLPTLTIAIPTFARERVLLDTLGQILDLRQTDMEILVVDQTPLHEEPTEQCLEAWGKEKRIRRLTLAQPSLTKARNTILREARGDVVLFLDDDVRIPAHLVREHLRFYSDDSVAAVTGQVFNCLDPANPPALEHPERGTRRHSDVRVVCDANNISGGNHSVRRGVALAVGGFDEVFRGSALGEDLDFAQRLRLAGYRIVYNPEAWIIHLGVKSGGCAVGLGSPWPEWQHAAGLLVYAFRHGRRLNNFWPVFWMALRNGPLRREVIVRPWYAPKAWWGFFRAMLYGWRCR